MKASQLHNIKLKWRKYFPSKKEKKETVNEFKYPCDFHEIRKHSEEKEKRLNQP